MFAAIVSSTKNRINTLKQHDEAVARWISHVISPHVVGIILTAVFAFQYGDNPWITLAWLAVLLPLIILPPFSYVLWLVHTGSLEDIYMPRRETRMRPLVVMMLWLAVCLGLIRYWAAPPVVEAIVMTSLVLLGVLSVVTLFWKISFHGATISAAATATVMMAGSWTWPIMLLVPLVGWSRIRLLRHTPRQVIYGSLVGAFLALIMVHGVLVRVL
ncbi:MAG: phosphatase PAP2 family protein [Anaerolineae bacterium]